MTDSKSDLKTPAAATKASKATTAKAKPAITKPKAPSAASKAKAATAKPKTKAPAAKAGTKTGTKAAAATRKVAPAKTGATPTTGNDGATPPAKAGAGKVSEDKLRAGLTSNPGHPASTIALCALLVARDKLPEATELARSALSLRPRNTDLLLNQARMLQKAHDMAGAEAAYRRALALDPANLPALRELAALSEQQDRLHEALFLLRLALQISPDHPKLKKRIRGLRERAFA